MNLSYNWLKDLIPFQLSAEELGRRLTGVGLAVEGIHAHGDDLVLDIDLTSNRPDCLSHLGVAREIGVITGSALGTETGNSNNEVPYPAALAGEIVRIEAPELCHRFTARIIRGVKIGPSPKWLSDRIEAIGERSINNVADITNYVMHELGQPMHSFDLDKLSGERIVVRRATKGEAITTLDEVERKLDDSMLAICDAEKPVAVAGVMGGLHSGITTDTVNVLLEVAYFKRESIRQTSRQLDLASEASYRFERGVDIQNLVRASKRAADLICELAGGEAGELIDVYPSAYVPTDIHCENISAAVMRFTGLDTGMDECCRILEALGVEYDDGSSIFTAPSWRHDLSIEEDLVEEIARHVGYDRIATELPPAFGAGEYQPTEVRKKYLRQTLTGIGFDEALSYSFIDTRWDDAFAIVPGAIGNAGGDAFVTLQDSVIEGAVRMRHTLLPGLLDAVRLNLNHQIRNIKLFEIGKIFSGAGDGLPNELEALALVITGGETVADRAMPVRDLDFYDARGAVEAALRSAGISDAVYSRSEATHLRSGQCAEISLGGRTIGYVGRLNEEIAAQYKFRQPVYAAEIDLQTALAVPTKPITYQPLAKYPGIVRDVSFVIKRTGQYQDIHTAIVEQNVELCQNVMFVDVYEGKGLNEDERSLTVRLEYRSDDRTLVEDEVESLHATIVTAVENKLGIKRRS